MEDKNTINRLLDELERQSEIIAALRAEIATNGRRIVELEKTLNTYREGAMQYSDTLDELHRRIAELETVRADGRTYVEGCTP